MDDEQPNGPPEDAPGAATASEPTGPMAAAESESAADGPARMSRGRLAVLMASLAVAAGVAAFVVLRSGEPPPAVAAPTVISTTTPPTTDPWPATQSRVATAKGPSILVRSAPPPEWSTATPVEVWNNPAPPASQATMAPRDALPRFDFPIQGRLADAAGWRFSNPTSFNDPFVMMVTERRGDWLKVQVPVRPNGTEGYVQAADVDVTTNSFRLDLRLGERTLRLYDGDRLVMQTQVAIGKPETKTPTGRFYVTDKVPQNPTTGVYGVLALPISAYSEQLDQFSNGVPVIALHGTNRPELLGQEVSNGCVRMTNEAVLRIAAAIPAGTPVDIIV